MHNLTGAMNNMHDTLGGSFINFPALSDLQTQLHDTQSSRATHVEKVRMLEGVIAEHELSRQLVEKSAAMRDGEWEEVDLGGAGGGVLVW